MHRACASRVRILCIIFEGGSGEAVLRNLGGGQTVVTLRYLGRGSKMVEKASRSL